MNTIIYRKSDYWRVTFSGPTEKLCFSVLGGLAGTFSFPTELALVKVFSVPKGLSVVQKEHHF